MQFRTRFEGELVLTKKDIRTKRPVKRAETISFSAKTMQHFGDSIKDNVKARRLVPLDNEARVFVGWEPLADEDLPKSQKAPVPSPTPETPSNETPPGDEDSDASGEGAGDITSKDNPRTRRR